MHTQVILQHTNNTVKHKKIAPTINIATQKQHWNTQKTLQNTSYISTHILHCKESVGPPFHLYWKNHCSTFIILFYMENRKQKTQFYPKIQERMHMCNDCKTILHCRNKSPSIISFFTHVCIQFVSCCVLWKFVYTQNWFP